MVQNERENFNALSERLLHRLRSLEMKIATAESCTGGLVASALTEIPGSSEVFERGFLTYSNESKVEMLGVQKATISKFGAVSEEVAREMALGAVDRSCANVAVAVTGVAGPGGSGLKPEGRVCFAVAVDDRVISHQTDFGALGRSRVRQSSVKSALDLVLAVADSDHAGAGRPSRKRT